MLPIHADQVEELVRQPLTLSLGTVDDAEPVSFAEVADYGPLVRVALQPSRVSVLCRLLQRSAGPGEGEYRTFVAGEQVVVAVVGGPRGDCVLLGKLSSAADPWPTKVAGLDSTENKFAFERCLTPYLFECAGRWLVRDTKTKALLTIADDGSVLVRDASGAGLALSADAFSVQDSTGKFALQLDFSGGRATVQVKDAVLSLASSSASPSSSALAVPGQLSISAAGQPAHEHACSTEAVANILVQVLLALGAANPGPLLGAALTGLAPTAVASALGLAAITPLLPPVALALQGAFAAAQSKPPGVPGQGQVQPGVGSSGILIG